MRVFLALVAVVMLVITVAAVFSGAWLLSLGTTAVGLVAVVAYELRGSD